MGKQRQLRLLSLLTVAALATSACQNPLGGSQSLVDPGHTPGIVAPAKGAEFVATSSQMKSTVHNKFIYQGTLSSPTNQIEQTTAHGTYRIFSNVQGQLVSGGQTP